MTISLTEKLKELPQRPGVYLFKNISRKVIYVGKAKSLANRVGSYFHIRPDTGTKTAALVSRINDIDYIEVETEFDALILEAELIKKYHPKYNIIQKDDKSYLYIVIRTEKLNIDGKIVRLAKIITQRKTELKTGDITFGPYTDGYSAKFILKKLRKLFPFRDCSTTKFATYHNRKKTCLYGDIGICSGPCVSTSTQDFGEYRNNIQSIKKVLSGSSNTLVKKMDKQMKTLSKLQEYEKAANVRDILQRLKYLRERVRLPEKYMENPTLLHDNSKKSIEEISKVLNILPSDLIRIECYDISNISGKEAVGSMVVSVDGVLEKKQYKRFKIKQKKTPDDYEMLREVLKRRLYHLKHLNNKLQKWPDPSLIIIDGGKGQVSAILKILNELNYKNHINLVGLAKREETLIVPKNGALVELKLDKDSLGLKHIIQLRDESHRFAQHYHHLLRSKMLKK